VVAFAAATAATAATVAAGHDAGIVLHRWQAQQFGMMRPLEGHSLGLLLLPVLQLQRCRTP
jgi:hypothetical protein